MTDQPVVNETPEQVADSTPADVQQDAPPTDPTPGDAIVPAEEDATIPRSRLNEVITQREDAEERARKAEQEAAYYRGQNESYEVVGDDATTPESTFDIKKYDAESQDFAAAIAAQAKSELMAEMKPFLDSVTARQTAEGQKLVDQAAETYGREVIERYGPQIVALSNQYPDLFNGPNAMDLLIQRVAPDVYEAALEKRFLGKQQKQIAEAKEASETLSPGAPAAAVQGKAPRTLKESVMAAAEKVGYPI